MLNFLKFTLFGLLILYAVCGLQAEIVKKEIVNNNETSPKEDDVLPQDMHLNEPQQMVTTIQENDKETIKEQLRVEPMPLLVDERDSIVKEIPQPSGEIRQIGEKKEIPQMTEKKEDSHTPADAIAQPTSSKRTGRQLFYSPNFFYIQNIGAEGSRCITSRGLVGICMGFDKCGVEQRRLKRQLTFYNLLQLPQYTAYEQQQPEEFCTFYDQYARTNSGVCCISINNIIPVTPATEQPPQPAVPATQDTPAKDDNTDNGVEESMKPMDTSKGPEPSEDSDFLEAPANFADFQPEPPKYDNTDFTEGNNIGYDPIDNLKQAQLYQDYIRYPWPSQFAGFSGVQQWPPPLPTHPPSSFGSWPPPIPTHPPNHHYPTHPPSTGGQFVPTTTKRPITVTTTKRPTYPNYPTYRPVTTTTTTTRRPAVIPGDGGGVSAMGLPLQCGTKNVVSPDQERIVGGTNASPYEFPWIAVLFKSGKQFCGGSLITNNHILTAAHCVARMTSWDVAALTVHLGDYNIRTDFEVKHVSRRIKRLVRHKGFDFSTLHNDIAILTLSEPVKYTHEVQPICLPTSAAQQSRSYSGHVATVAGWGSLRENGPQPSILQKVQIPIWNNAECAQKYGRAAPGGIIESMVCAGQASKDSCSGDSGGPMIVNEGGRYVQVGIVSWGIGCGKGQYPGVYTRVTSLLPWIYKNIK